MDPSEHAAMRLRDVAPHTNQISGSVVDAAFRVHTLLGPGLLERMYRECLAAELEKRGHQVDTEVLTPVDYEGRRLEAAFRLDLLVDGKVLVEVKAVEELRPVHWAQVRTYLKLTGHPIGLLVNFHTTRLKDGIFRIVQTSP